MKQKALLHQHGIRSTRPRELVAEVFLALGKRHFSVDDIMRSLSRRKKKVSRATVFRTINVYVRKKLLTAIDLGKGCRMYERADDGRHHDHLYCIQCGGVIEFQEDAIEDLQRKVCRRKKFQPLSHTLRIKGICKKCRMR